MSAAYIGVLYGGFVKALIYPDPQYELGVLGHILGYKIGMVKV